MKDKYNWVIDREGRPPALRISLLQKWYVFPWNHFIYASGDGDEVKAAFTTHDVIFKGVGLWRLLDHIQNQSVVSVEVALRSEKFDPQNESIVYEITIESIDGK